MTSNALHRAIELVLELTAISSPTGDTAGIRKALDCLATALDEHGLPGEIDERRFGTPEAPVLLAGDLDATNPLLLVGHVDTVLPASRPERQDDRIVATGAIDMKGGLAAFVGALVEIEARGESLPEGVLIAVVPDEEIGGKISIRTVETLGAQARALWVLEPGEDHESGETLVLGRRGLTTFTVSFQGQAAHAGNAPEQGRSALLAATEWSRCATRAAKQNRTLTMNLGRLVAGDTSFVEHLGVRADMVGTERQTNVVPDRAVLDAEIRFLRTSTRDEFLHWLGGLAKVVGGQHEVKTGFVSREPIRPLVPTKERQAYAEHALRAASERGWRLSLEIERGGISFPNFLPAGSEIPVLDGLGPTGAGMHSREEWMSIASLERRIDLLADLLTTQGVTSPDSPEE
ncbi:MAG: M20/M25/M40 family metallo-hydrolase [Acidobacteriota bacterium]